MTELGSAAREFQLFILELSKCESKEKILSFAIAKTVAASSADENEAVLALVGTVAEQISCILDMIAQEEKKSGVGKDAQLPTQGVGKNKGLKAPAGLLSINDMRAVYSGLELLWRWNIKPVLTQHLALLQLAEEKSGNSNSSSSNAQSKSNAPGFAERGAMAVHPKSMFVSAEVIGSVNFIPKYVNISYVKRTITPYCCRHIPYPVVH